MRRQRRQVHGQVVEPKPRKELSIKIDLASSVTVFNNALAAIRDEPADEQQLSHVRQQVEAGLTEYIKSPLAARQGVDPPQDRVRRQAGRTSDRQERDARAVFSAARGQARPRAAGGRW